MTSNIPVDLGNKEGLGFHKKNNQESVDVDEAVKKALKHAGMEDAFINRIDVFVVFTPFSKDDLMKIAGLMAGDMLKDELKEKGLKIEMNEEARSFLADKGNSPGFWAKELRRVLQTDLLAPLGTLINTFNPGETIFVGLNQDKTQLEFSKQRQEQQALAD
jgi:ATP-dependent Clp protease ATP-binding subunit ClpA